MPEKTINHRGNEGNKSGMATSLARVRETAAKAFDKPYVAPAISAVSLGALYGTISYYNMHHLSVYAANGKIAIGVGVAAFYGLLDSSAVTMERLGKFLRKNHTSSKTTQ